MLHVYRFVRALVISNGNGNCIGICIGNGNDIGNGISIGNSIGNAIGNDICNGIALVMVLVMTSNSARYMQVEVKVTKRDHQTSTQLPIHHFS